MRLSSTIIFLCLFSFSACAVSVTNTIPNGLKRILEEQYDSSQHQFNKNSHLEIKGTLSKDDVHYLAEFTKKNNITHLNLSKARFREIGMGLFSNCDKLAYIKLPGNLHTIAKQAFKNCSSLESIHLPKSVTSVGTEAFWGCTRLEKLSYHKKLSWIGQDAFGHCPLKTIKKHRNKNVTTPPSLSNKKTLNLNIKLK